MKFNKNLRITFHTQSGVKMTLKVFGLNKFALMVFGLLLDFELRGAIVGFIIGCFMDTEYVFPEKKEKRDFRVSFMMLGAFVMQTPGVGSKLSSNVVRSALVNTFGETYTQRRLSFFYELLRQRIQVEAICGQIQQYASVGEKNTLLRFLFELGEQPGVNKENLHHSINYLAARIGVPFETVQQVYNTVKGKMRDQQYSEEQTYEEQAHRPEQEFNSLSSSFTTLGLASTANEKEVKRAYYRLAKKFHPDSNPQASADEKKLLESKLRLVIEAYERICEVKNWK